MILTRRKTRHCGNMMAFAAVAMVAWVWPDVSSAQQEDVRVPESMLEQLDEAQERYERDVQTRLVAYMPLETMFPDERARALAKAAGKGRKRTIERLVAEGVDVNARGRRNATPLFWALKKGSVRGFGLLLELGADPNVLYDDGGTVMHWAASHKKPEFLELALNHGGNPNLVNPAGDMQAPIHDTITIGEGPGLPEKTALLLEAGADIHLKDRVGWTVLHSAAAQKRYDVVLELLERGADPEARFKRPNWEWTDSGERRKYYTDGENLSEMLQSDRGVLVPDSEQHMWMDRVESWLGQHQETSGGPKG
jgi:ankyrin repeat protein